MSTVVKLETRPTSSGGNYIAPILDCGHHGNAGLGLGDSEICRECKNNADDLAWLQSLDMTTISHARYIPRFGGQYAFYRRDTTSPSGVSLVRIVSATSSIETLLDAKRIAPLSPSER